MSFVPLQSPSLGLRFLSNIRGIPGLRASEWRGNPLGQRVFKYSWLYRITSEYSSSVSALESLTVRPGTLASRMSFIASTSLFVGDRRDLPSSHPSLVIFAADQGRKLCRKLA